MDEDVVASARPPELEAERLNEPPHVRERDVRQVAASESREEPPWIHGATLPTSADEVFSVANLDAVSLTIRPMGSSSSVVCWRAITATTRASASGLSLLITLEALECRGRSRGKRRQRERRSG